MLAKDILFIRICSSAAISFREIRNKYHNLIRRGVKRLNALRRYRSRFIFCALAIAIMFQTTSTTAVLTQAALPEVEVKASELKVIPGGQTVGVKLKTVGVLVVGHHMVRTRQGNYSPAEKAKLQMGDRIVVINNKRIESARHFADLLRTMSKQDQMLTLQVERGNQQLTISILPALDEMTNQYRLGVYVRDSAAGIGTLTFYSNELKRYGALGHMITDADTHSGLPVGEGEIVPSEVTSIQKGVKGAPGEKRAQMINNSPPYGTIEKNTDFGIFGELLNEPNQTFMNQPLPIATREQVKEGPAQIYSVINRQKIEKFDIEIVHLNQQNQPATRSMVLRITDPRLLNKTGGIIQGMSGSPIIQNGRIVGAVTHVFVNDPTSGYGCYIEWMLKDAGIKVKAA
jgi:stage IV sporulation protein B